MSNAPMRLPPVKISIHALREEGDLFSVLHGSHLPRISIHALREEGDLSGSRFTDIMPEFQSTPSARRATAAFALAPITGDHFNPRPPRGGRLVTPFSSARLSRFQSTPSARRATTSLLIFRPSQANFNPRPPRGGRLWVSPLCFWHLLISIHALREEGDYVVEDVKSKATNFNPRPPRGGRPWPAPGTSAAGRFQSTPSARRATSNGKADSSSE